MLNCHAYIHYNSIWSTLLACELLTSVIYSCMYIYNHSITQRGTPAISHFICLTHCSILSRTQIFSCNSLSCLEVIESPTTQLIWYLTSSFHSLTFLPVSCQTCNIFPRGSWEPVLTDSYPRHLSSCSMIVLSIVLSILFHFPSITILHAHVYTLLRIIIPLGPHCLYMQ